MAAADVRIQRLQQRIAKLGASAMYLRDTASIEWLTGFEGVFDDEQAHAAFIPAHGGQVLVHTDSRYSTAMEREAEGTPFAVDSERASFSQWALSAWEESGLAGSLAVEDSLTVAEFKALEAAFSGAASLEVTAQVVMDERSVKDALEVERMRDAQAVTDAAFSHILEFIRPGMTERQIQLELDSFMLLNGADSLAFPSIVASGANGASPHALVSNKTVMPGECIVMDFGARARGYCSDMTRTVFVGKPDERLRCAWDALRRANETVEEALCPGMTGAQAHELAISVLDSAGYAGRMGHGLGHGVGIQVHEEPSLSPRNKEALVPGNVVTVEPGIYIPGEFGMRLEDFGVITENGFDVFTASTHEMVII
ncbi:MAG: aminopeptidase P family protein [Eggerthellaceae bacterium]|nr:aminopeptidase P family protein [Eggerthellaceae bacterium]